MARPTKGTIQLAKRLGRPPSTVQGLLDRGYGPVEALVGRRERSYWDAVAKETGPGHDPAVAILKLAAAGHATATLRDRLRELASLGPGEEDTDDADELVAYARQASHLAPVWSSIVDLARSAGAPVEHAWTTNPPEPNLPEVRAGAALLPLADATLGDPLEPADTAELGQLLDIPASRISGQTYEMPVSDNLALVQEGTRLALAANAWLEEATSAELVRGVQAARKLVDALGVIFPQFAALGDEEQWRWAGRLAPVAEPLFRTVVPLVRLLRSQAGSNLAAGELAFLDAIDPSTAVSFGAEDEP